MSKQFWGVIVVIILIFVGIFAFNGSKSGDTKNSGGGSTKPTEHIVGKGTSGVTVVEYGDYQCPYCEQFESVVEQVRVKYNDQIKFQFRNFPITSAHKNAFAAARAAEAASLQGKFWEMHDQLYNSNNWQQWTEANGPNSMFEEYAKTIGLDTNKFKTDFASSTVNDAINADSAEGTKLGVTGTPSFFIDGKQVKLNPTVEDFSKVIDAAIKQKASAKQ